MIGPLPESLRMGVCEAYNKTSYGRFMVCVARVQDGTMSVEDAYADVFDILGYDGGSSIMVKFVVIIRASLAAPTSTGCSWSGALQRLQ